MSIHSVKQAQSHLAWDNRIQPVIHVNSGETVTFDCLDASNGQITASSTPAAVSTLVLAKCDQVNGPVYVRNALPGDTLQVDILDITTADWGWTACIPGFGLLADEFQEPALKLWRLNTSEGFTWFDEQRGMKTPLRPFAGEMGVAPAKEGAHSTIPPYATGGNIDTRHVTAGSTLYLPVEVEGALFSIGDGHAAQGDGGTAIETPMTVKVRLTVRKDKSYTKTPHFSTPAAPTSDAYYWFPCRRRRVDIKDAARASVRHMIEVLVADYKLDRVEAYMLCSVAGDLRMHEVVDMPNYVIGFMLPKSVVPIVD
ncbi:hypothetical protein PLICRDRAFT_179256 [Plicaturopsis crispa FD-325 SS-3]|uniref:Formamidase n=1 Tax=Plicaturopsis crispa FD-325 SS-3 TaxID=944288 RepID=A0A0C9T9J8_PLICR|nr:hypothetical protein PLICRDRAFT_179256 [Plicaturopsis crispa FD-325 SS-3]